MKGMRFITLIGMAAGLLSWSALQAAVPNLSTGADGPFQPTVNVSLDMPPDGIFNFTTVNIPAGVTVGFKKNTANTPVYWLVSGDVTIAGVVHVNGSNGLSQTSSGSLENLVSGGAGGPGGYDGGAGARPDGHGGNASGPGGARGGACPGFGGGYNGNGGGSWSSCTGYQGRSYGSAALVPLIGGSGGAGGQSNSHTNARYGSSGGGGGGAIMISTPGTVRISGQLLANGGTGGNSSVTNAVDGGAGSGGAIRIVAGRIDTTSGAIRTQGGGSTASGNSGANGRIRLEADFFTNISAIPTPSLALPAAVFPAKLPRISVTRVAGVDVPAVPTGRGDVLLPSTTTNPVTVDLAAVNIPVGQTISVKMIPDYGTPVTATSTSLVGTEAASTASATIDFPQGESLLLATASFTVEPEQAVALSQFTGGEHVASIEVSSSLQGTEWVLITQSGQRHQVTSEQLSALN